MLHLNNSFLAGETVGFNNSVFLAEREVADRNYALAYYMKENKCFPKGINIKECMDFWYQVTSLDYDSGRTKSARLSTDFVYILDGLNHFCFFSVVY